MSASAVEILGRLLVTAEFCDKRRLPIMDTHEAASLDEAQQLLARRRREAFDANLQLLTRVQNSFLLCSLGSL